MRVLPAGAERGRPPALRAVALRRPAGQQPPWHPRTGRGAQLPARPGADEPGGDTAGGLRPARPPAGHGGRLVRSQLRIPPPAPGAAVAGWRGVRHATGRNARPRRLGRRPGRGLHRIDDHRLQQQGHRMTARRRYWLMKSEPDAFSIDDLKRVGTEPWNGVRNYQARNFMRDGMQVGDGVLFYHSNTEVPGIVGTATVASKAYPDETQFEPKSDYFDPKSTREEPRWFLVDVAFDRKLKRTISLDEIKKHADKLGEDFALIRKGNRLSVFPVQAAQWKYLLSLE